MAFRAIADLGGTPETTVLVGDMSVDRDTARNAGLRFYAIATGSESRESLLAGKPDRLLERFDDLLQCFPPLPGNPAPAAG
jgi:phosphoglycolate phosphatase-like HAD superfamily hydrolase